MTTRHRPWLTAAISAAVTVILLTAFAGAPPVAAAVRPADGNAPRVKYRWIAPPPFFAAGNEQPSPVRAAVPLRSTGSVPSSVLTPDGQVVLTLGSDAIAPHGTDRRVDISITPTAPAYPPAAGLRANGNAYRITMRYRPSGTPVPPLTNPGTLILAIPELNTQLLRSGGGSTWVPVESRSLPPRNLSLSARFDRPGTYLSATNLPELAGPDAADDHTVAIVAGVVAVALLVGAALVVRRRRRSA